MDFDHWEFISSSSWDIVFKDDSYKPKCQETKECKKKPESICDSRLYVDPGVDRTDKPINYQIMETYDQSKIEGNVIFNEAGNTYLIKKKIQQVNCLADEEYLLRLETAKRYLHRRKYIIRNPDADIPFFLGYFSKSLPHDELGHPDPEAIAKLFDALNVSIRYLDRIPYPGTLRLVSPSAIYSLDLVGPFKSTVPIPIPPSILSAECAAEMVELYGMALARDIPFSDYHRNCEIKRIIHDLNQITDFTGPKIDGKVTVGTLFRGNNIGDLKGPYISQFLYLPFKYGCSDVEQKYPYNAPGVNFMTTWETALVFKMVS